MSFEIPFEPVPKERARSSGAGGFYTPEKTRAFEAAVGWMGKLNRPAGKLIYGPVELSGLIVCTRQNGDLSNYIKAIEDGLNKALWKDDKQVKRYKNIEVIEGDRPRIELVITTL